MRIKNEFLNINELRAHRKAHREGGDSGPPERVATFPPNEANSDDLVSVLSSGNSIISTFLQAARYQNKHMWASWRSTKSDSRRTRSICLWRRSTRCLRLASRRTPMLRSRTTMPQLRQPIRWEHTSVNGFRLVRLVCCHSGQVAWVQTRRLLRHLQMGARSCEN